MTDYAAVLRELMVAGYEGAHLLAAFERLCAAIGGGVGQIVDDAQAAAPKAVDRRRKASAPDRRQLSMMLPSDGGQAKAPPMTAAERQAKRRATLKSVTLRDINADQTIENIEESRNVTKIRDSGQNVPDFVGSGRDGVTRRGKKNSPHTPLRKTLPPNPPSEAFVTVHWDDPLLAYLEQLHGRPFKRFGSGRTVTRRQLAAAQTLMAEASTALPLKATGS